MDNNFLPGMPIDQSKQNRIDGGNDSDRSQEKHIRGFILRGEASPEDAKLYKERYGDAAENDANEKLRIATYAREQEERKKRQEMIQLVVQKQQTEFEQLSSN
jgi:hypothetical protein